MGNKNVRVDLQGNHYADRKLRSEMLIVWIWHCGLEVGATPSARPGEVLTNGIKRPHSPHTEATSICASCWFLLLS